MIIEFKTRRNTTNGSRKYLAIDTGAETYTTNNPHMITSGIEIRISDYKEMIEKLKRLEYKELDRIV